MGQWHISIQGTGCHHNRDHPGDADRMASRFCRELSAAGHAIEYATITCGGRESLPWGQPRLNPETGESETIPLGDSSA